MAISSRLAALLGDMSSAILEAQKPLRIIRALSWKSSVEREFFAKKCRVLPSPSYQISSNVADSLTRLQHLTRRLSGHNEIEHFLRETCNGLATAARMLLAIGTKDFYFNSVELYGRPSNLSSDRKTTHLDLASHFERVIADFKPTVSLDDLPTFSAEEAAEILRQRFSTFFIGHPVNVKLVGRSSAVASSSAAEIRLHRDARFSQRTLRQLEHHEGQVHLASTLNGRAQTLVPFIGVPSPRTTRTQEGLAVFAEFASGSIGISRLRRLCDRTRAIHMAEEGATFIDLYRSFLARGDDPHTCFESARRVMRGGIMKGGAPFTKDGCYLDGLLYVTNFLRIALTKGQSQLVRWLFVGKLSVEDTPLFDRLAREGVLQEPRFVPGWARDLSYITAFMSFSAFLGRSDLRTLEQRLDDQLARAEAPLE